MLLTPNTRSQHTSPSGLETQPGTLQDPTFYFIYGRRFQRENLIRSNPLQNIRANENTYWYSRQLQLEAAVASATIRLAFFK